MGYSSTDGTIWGGANRSCSLSNLVMGERRASSMRLPYLPCWGDTDFIMIRLGNSIGRRRCCRAGILVRSFIVLLPIPSTPLLTALR